MKIYCISEGELYAVQSGKAEKLDCKRVSDYLATIDNMRRRDEWKTTGTGAKFMGVEQKTYTDYPSQASALLRSAGVMDNKLVYSTFIDGMGGMYFKDPDTKEENYIFANRKTDIQGISCYDGKCAISEATGRYECHIAIVDAQSGYANAVTEGFTSETHPFISRKNSDNIYYTAMGFARDSGGNVYEKSPCSVYMYNGATKELEELVENPEYDYIKPSDDTDGNLYYIRRKYEPTRKESNLGKDILLFPVRIIKAIGGFLSMFSMAFGGEPLRTGGSNPAKTKEKSERELFVEGNIITAREISEKETEQGIIPTDWTLIRKRPDGQEEILKKGIMDYRVTADKSIVYSDGSSISVLHPDGKSERLVKLKLANSIAVME